MCAAGFQTVVLDAGSYSTKAGFAGESFPRCVFPTVVARFRQEGLFDGLPIITCGKEAVMRRGLSNLVLPVQNGLVQDWDEMEKFWHHTFYKELFVAPEAIKVLHAVDPMVSRKDREKMAEILFESFAVPCLNLVKAPVLALHASGRVTGVVWENGHGCCYAAPVFEGYPLKNAIVTSTLTGSKITEILFKELLKLGYSFTTPTEIHLMHKIKEETCYVASDYEDHMNNYSQNETKYSFTLPDGQLVHMDKERFQVPEALFQPSSMGLGNSPSIVDDIVSSIGKCDLDYRETFFSNIVISGGSSMFSGLKKRLHQELALRVVKIPGVQAKVDGIPFRQNSVWAGGSLLASVAKDLFWVTKKEYEDDGPDSINLKFF